MKTKKPSLFLILYLSVLALGIVLLIVGAVFLNRWLTAFEASEAIYPAEAAYEKYFSDGDFSSAIEAAGLTVGEFEDANAVEAVLKKAAEGKTMTFYSAQVGEEGARYNVVLTDPEAEPDDAGIIPSQKIATIHLTRNEEELAFGFRGYSFSRLELFAEPSESVTVTLPATSKLFLGDKEVGDGYKTGESDHPYNAFLKSGVTGITLATYTVEGLYLPPEIRCVDANGREMLLTQNEDGSFSAELNYDEALKEAYGDRILTGMKEYAKWMQADAEIDSVIPYFDTSSQFYKNTAANPWIYAWGEHNSYEFQNELIEDFYAYDENTFSCHVSFDQVLHRWGRQDFVDRLDMIVFVRKVGGSYKIYDRIVQ